MLDIISSPQREGVFLGVGPARASQLSRRKSGQAVFIQCDGTGAGGTGDPENTQGSPNS